MAVKEHQPTYSSIIRPKEFNRLMTEQHLYIAATDDLIRKLVEREVSYVGAGTEVVELGCGPARLLQNVSRKQDIHITGIDHDPVFITFGKSLIQKERINAKMVVADMTTYMHPLPVDVFYSQGVHHHIKKGHHTQQYLENVRRQLKAGGVFVVSDEFLPEYKTSEERKVRTIIWHSHIIAHALNDRHQRLAEEEAKTLLDDLAENEDPNAIKSVKQIKTVLRSVAAINLLAEKGLVIEAEAKANELLASLSGMRNTKKAGDDSIDLSRGDYKISASAFREEVEAAGFRVEQDFGIGPVHTIGGFRVFVLKKA